jgi:hypothetical protein
MNTDADRGSYSEERMQKRITDGHTIRLQDQVKHPTLFRTPDAGMGRGNFKDEESYRKWMEKGGQVTLNAQVQFPTPRATDGKRAARTLEGAEKESLRGHGLDLPSAVQIFPTPTVCGNHNRKGSSETSGDGLATYVQMLPTPTCNDAKNNASPSQTTEGGRNSNALNVAAGGSLNPDWVEILMGLPRHWTDIT